MPAAAVIAWRAVAVALASRSAGPFTAPVWCAGGLRAIRPLDRKAVFTQIGDRGTETTGDVTDCPGRAIGIALAVRGPAGHSMRIATVGEARHGIRDGALIANVLLNYGHVLMQRAGQLWRSGWAG